MAAERTPPRLITLVLLTSLAVMSLNIFLPSLGRIAEAFATSYTQVALSISGFLLVSAVLQLVMGPLSDRYGRRPVLLAGLVVFVLASLGCALAWNIWVFLGFRMLQGGVVAGMVLSRAVIRDMAEPEEAARLLSQVGAAMALAPLLAPVAGGMIEAWLGWRAVFGFLALSGLGILVLTWVDLGETNTRGQNSFAAQFRAYPQLLRAGPFWAYCGVLVFSLGGFYAYLAGAPLVGEQAFGLGSTALGMLMGATALGFLLGNLLATRVAARLGSLRLILIGRWLSLLGCLAGIVLLAMLMHPGVVVAAAVVLGFGNGLTLPGANVGVMSVAPHLAGSASGLSGALGVTVGAVITPLVGLAVEGARGPFALLAAMALAGLAGLLSAYAVKALQARGETA